MDITVNADQVLGGGCTGLMKGLFQSVEGFHGRQYLRNTGIRLSAFLNGREKLTVLQFDAVV
jgi:hypothetical protein